MVACRVVGCIVHRVDVTGAVVEAVLVMQSNDMLRRPSELLNRRCPGMDGSRKPSCCQVTKTSLEARTAAGEIIVSTMLAQ